MAIAGRVRVQPASGLGRGRSGHIDYDKKAVWKYAIGRQLLLSPDGYAALRAGSGPRSVLMPAPVAVRQ